MAIVEELIRIENNNTLSFGNFLLEEKQKVADFKFKEDSYKVKTFKDITKLEKNDAFLYESVPGTAVFFFEENSDGMAFNVDCKEDAQITLGLEQDILYRVVINDENMGSFVTGIGGKLSFNIDAIKGGTIEVKVLKA